MILVPGTFNSIIPGVLSVLGPQNEPFSKNQESTPYFSRAVLETVREQYCNVYVVSNLSPLGDFWENGKRVYNETLAWKKQVWGNRRVALDIIAHSAGGFYSFAAMDLNEKSGRRLRFGSVSLISTPLNGLDLIDRVLRYPLLRVVLEKLLNANPRFFDLRGLWQMQTPIVSEFLAKVRLPLTVQIHAYAGRQTPAPTPVQEMDSVFLDPLLHFTNSIISQMSDGIVSWRSALGPDSQLMTAEESFFDRLYSHPNDPINLDHVEQVWDVRYLKLLGFHNTEWVEVQQRKLYSKLATEALARH